MVRVSETVANSDVGPTTSPWKRTCQMTSKLMNALSIVVKKRYEALSLGFGCYSLKREGKMSVVC